QEQVRFLECGVDRLIERRIGVSMHSGCWSETAPLAIVIVYSGSDVRSMNSRSSVAASAHQTPLPAMTTGLLADFRSFKASRTSPASGGAAASTGTGSA